MMMGMVALGTAAPDTTLRWLTTDAPAGLTFSAGNTTMSSSQGFNQMCIANVAPLSGKQCWSLSYTGSANDIAIGVSTVGFNANSGPGDEALSIGFHTGGGAGGAVFQSGGSINFPYWATVAHTDAIIVGWDTATNTIEIFKNGSSIGTQVCTPLGGSAYPAVGSFSNQAITIVRTVSPPSGYTAL